MYLFVLFLCEALGIKREPHAVLLVSPLDTSLGVSQTSQDGGKWKQNGFNSLCGRHCCSSMELLLHSLEGIGQWYSPALAL